MTGIFLFLLGLCVGSFINCLVYRINHPKAPPWWQGRSFCPKCKHQLSWQDNIPLLSFILLQGRCRYCRSPISWQYPLVELATAGLTLLIFKFFPFRQGFAGQAIFNLLMIYSLIVVFVSDWQYMIIPDGALIFAAIIALVSGISISSILAALAGAGFFWLLVLVTKGKGMGWGDVKLAGLMGLILDWQGLVLALFLAFLTGAALGVILILLGKKKFGQQIPFGPFLASSTVISLFFSSTIWPWFLEKALL